MPPLIGGAAAPRPQQDPGFNPLQDLAPQSFTTNLPSVPTPEPLGPASEIPQPEPEQEGFLGKLGYALDTPGALLRGALAGEPFHRATGQHVLKNWGLINQDDNPILSAPGIAGLAADFVLDPLNLIGVGELTHAGQAAKLVGGHLGEAAAQLAKHAGAEAQSAAAVKRALQAGEEVAAHIPRPPPIHPVLGSLIDGAGKAVENPELVSRLANQSTPLGEAAQELLHNQAARGLGDEALQMGTEAGQQVDAGQRAMLKVGGHYDPLGLFRLGGKMNPINYLPEIPVLTKGITLPEKTLIEGANTAQGIQNAWRGFKELPGVAQIGDLFNKAGVAGSKIGTGAADKLEELRNKYFRDISAGEAAAGDRAGEISAQLQQIPALPPVANPTIEGTAPKLWQGERDATAEARAQQFYDNENLNKFAPADLHMKQIGEDLNPAAAAQMTGQFPELPDKFKAAPGMGMGRLQLAGDFDPLNITRETQRMEPALDKAAAVQLGAESPELPQKFGGIPGLPTLDKAVADIKEPVYEDFMKPKPGNMVQFWNKDALGGARGRGEQVVGRAFAFNEDTKTFSIKTKGGEQYIVPESKVARPARNIGNDYYAARAEFNAAQAKQDIQTVPQEFRANTKEAAQDAKAMYAAADGIPYGESMDANAEALRQRQKRFDILGLDDKITDQAKSLPKALEEWLPKLGPEGILNARSVELIPGGAENLGIGDKISIGGDTFTYEGPTRTGKAKLKDDFPVEYPFDRIPIDRGTNILRAEQAPADIENVFNFGGEPHGRTALPENAGTPPVLSPGPVGVSSGSEPGAALGENHSAQINPLEDLARPAPKYGKLNKAADILAATEQKLGVVPTQIHEELSGSAQIPNTSAEMRAPTPPSNPQSSIVNRQSLQAQFHAEQHPLIERRLAGDRSATITNPHPITGITEGEFANDRFKQLAIDQAAKTGEPVTYAAGDLANLGGINKALGKTGANEHLAAIGEILREEIGKLGENAALVHHGGDEFGVTAIGIPPAEVKAALTTAEQRVAQYATENGLDTIEHTKLNPDGTRKNPGTGIVFSDPVEYSPVTHGSQAKLGATADQALEEIKNVRGKQTPQNVPASSNPSGEIAASGRPAIAAEAQQAIPGAHAQAFNPLEDLQAPAADHADTLPRFEDLPAGPTPNSQSAIVNPQSDIMPFDPLRLNQAEARMKQIESAQRLQGGHLTTDQLDAHRFARDRQVAEQAREKTAEYLNIAGAGTQAAAEGAHKLIPPDASPELSRRVTDFLEHNTAEAPEIAKIGGQIRDRYDELLKLEQDMGLASPKLRAGRIDYTTHVSTPAGHEFFQRVGKNKQLQGDLFVKLEEARQAKGLAPNADAIKPIAQQRLDANLTAAGKRGAPRPIPSDMTRTAAGNAFDGLSNDAKRFIMDRGLTEEFGKFAQDIHAAHGSQIPRLEAYHQLGVGELNDVFTSMGATRPVFSENPAAQLFAREARHVRATAAQSLLDQAGETLGHKIPEHQSAAIPIRGNEQFTKLGDGSIGITDMVTAADKRGMPRIGFPDLATAQAVRDMHARLSNPEEVGQLLQWYDQATKVMKSYITRAFPAHIMGNHIGSRLQAWLGGVDLAGAHYDYAQKLASGVNFDVVLGDGTKATRDSLLKEGEKLGITNGGYYENLLEKGLADTKQTSFNPLNPDNVFLKTAEKASSALVGGPGHLLAGGSLKNLDSRMVEDVDRWGVYIHERMKGAAPTAAADTVNKLMIDFSNKNLSPFEQKYLNRVAFFYKHQRNVIPLVAEALIENLHRVGDITALGQQPGKPDFIPPWANEGLPLALGHDDHGNTQMAYNLHTPVEFAFDPISGFSQGLQRGGEKLLSHLNPLIKAPLELATNQDFFLGKNLDDARKAPHYVEGLPQNLKDLLGVHEIPRADGTHKTEMDPYALYALRNSPLSRLSNTASRLSDSSKGIPEDLSNLLSGARVVTVNNEDEHAYAQKNAIKARLKELEHQGKAGEFTRFTSGPEKNPEAKALVAALYKK